MKRENEGISDEVNAILDQLMSGQPEVYLCVDGEEPMKIEYEAIALDVCKDGHLHGIALGDNAALTAFLAGREGSGEIEMIKQEDLYPYGQAAQPVASLDEVPQAIQEALVNALFDEVERSLDAKNVHDGPLKAHNDELKRLALSRARGEATSDDVNMHMARAMVDPEYLADLKRIDPYDSAAYEPFDTLLEAALAGLETPGDTLLKEQPHYIEAALDERENHDGTIVH